jgi:hypothetical protein
MRGTAISNILVSRSAKCQLTSTSPGVPGTKSSGGGVELPPDLRSRRMRVRVIRVRMHDPSLRTPAAHDAAQEHCAAIARDGVVVPGHVTIDPVPHKSPFRTPIAAERQGECHVHGRLTYMKTCAESKDVDFCEDSTARLRRRSCTRNYALEIPFHNRTFTFAYGPKTALC